MLIVILIIIGILLFLLYRNLKVLKFGAVNLFTGELGAGKSALSLNRAINQYRINLFKFYISYFISVCASSFGSSALSLNEKPLLYSNIPLYKINYIPLTNKVLKREERINKKSIVFIDEISLVVDNMDFKDSELNESIKMFIKLFRHYSHGGQLFINTQNIQDNHYIIKRVLNKYYYIHSKIRLPFISILKVREFLYSEDSSIQNTISEDLENDLSIVVVSNSIFKRYDSLCYSILTDDLPYYRENIKFLKHRNQLKTKQILKLKGAIKK